MFTFQPIGYVRSPFTDSSEIPKGPGTRHQADGILEINAEFEEGLLDRRQVATAERARIDRHADMSFMHGADSQDLALTRRPKKDAATNTCFSFFRHPALSPSPDHPPLIRWMRN